MNLILLMICRLSLLLCLTSGLVAQDSVRAPVEPTSLPTPDQPVEPTRPAIRRLDDGCMMIGSIRLDPQAREILVPASVNQTEGILEFLLVHQNGKIHESLLVTDIPAIHLNIAFKLLGYKASPELYSMVKEEGGLSSEFQEATEEEKKASRVKVLVEFERNGESVRHPVSKWISHATTEKDMPSSPWIYGGSFHYQGKFAAETSGDLFAIFLSNAALVNFSGKDNDLDDVWLPNSTRVPPEGASVKLVIQPL